MLVIWKNEEKIYSLKKKKRSNVAGVGITIATAHRKYKKNRAHRNKIKYIEMYDIITCIKLTCRLSLNKQSSWTRQQQ